MSGELGALLDLDQPLFSLIITEHRSWVGRFLRHCLPILLRRADSALVRKPHVARGGRGVCRGWFSRSRTRGQNRRVSILALNVLENPVALIGDARVSTTDQGLDL